MGALRLTDEQAAERSRRRQARLDRSVSDVAEDIRRQRREHSRLYIRAVARGDTSV